MSSFELQKRHFAAIASAVHDAGAPFRAAGYNPDAILSAVAIELALVLRAYNPAFDRDRFIEACLTGVHHKTALNRARRGV